MIMRNCYLKLFLFIIVLSLLPLHGVEIKFYNCDGEELVPDKIAYAKKWKEAAENVINNQDVIDCLPRNWKNSAETWMKYSKVKIKICRQKLYDPNNCGNLDLDNNIIVPEENNSGCGCEEATIFHEFIHQAVPVQENETNDRKIRGCEKLILTKFIKNCRDNPPAGDPCDCMDQQNNQSPCRDPFEPPPRTEKKEK